MMNPSIFIQGEVTVKLLEDMDIRTFVVGKDTTEEELARYHEAVPGSAGSRKRCGIRNPQRCPFL